MADMGADMEVGMVVDMEADIVDNMVADNFDQVSNLDKFHNFCQSLRF